MFRRRQFLVAAASGPLIAGCTGTGNGDGAATEPSATTAADGAPDPTDTAGDAAVTVEMADTSFDPLTVEVEAGTTVAWVNRDGFEHDVTAAQFRDGAADWSFSETLGADERAASTFDSAGVFDYYCTIHGEGSMCGAVLVGGATVDGSLPCAGGGGSGAGPY